MKPMTTAAVLNQKGGVGKTTVTLGLASAAQAAGHKVLVVDLDPQASASWTLGIELDDETLGVSDVIESASAGAADDAIVESLWGPEVEVLPSGRALAARERDSGRDLEIRLRRSLDGVAERYDIVLIDCPPSLGGNTMSALAAADLAVIVVEPASYSLRGVAAVADTIDDVWDRLNPDLDLAGVIVNKMPAVSVEAERRFEELAEMVGRKSVWKPTLPNRVTVNQALGEQQPIHAYGYRAREVSEAFDALYAKLRRASR
jgi:cellulose biosynthesis protein BcsQ